MKLLVRAMASSTHLGHPTCTCMWLEWRAAAAVRAVGMWPATADPLNHVRQAHCCRCTPGTEPFAHALVIVHADLTLVTIFLTTRCKTSPHVVDEQDKCWRQWKTS